MPPVVGLDGTGDDSVNDFVFDEEDDESIKCAGRDTGNELLIEANEWRPLSLLSEYEDIDLRDDRIAVVVLLPSGVHERPDNIGVEIGNDTIPRIFVA